MVLLSSHISLRNIAVSTSRIDRKAFLLKRRKSWPSISWRIHHKVSWTVRISSAPYTLYRLSALRFRETIRKQKLNLVLPLSRAISAPSSRKPTYLLLISGAKRDEGCVRKQKVVIFPVSFNHIHFCVNWSLDNTRKKPLLRFYFFASQNTVIQSVFRVPSQLTIYSSSSSSHQRLL